jgi:tetratricopeptide (TPR) repeat protein
LQVLDQNLDAIAFLNTYIDKTYSEIAWHQMGRLYYGVEDYENAIRAFDYATNYDEFLVLLWKEQAYERLKRYEEAIVSYTRTIELDDATSYALLRIGNVMKTRNSSCLTILQRYSTRRSVTQRDCYYRFFMCVKKNYQALFYVNKALAIDNQNNLYWKRYADKHELLRKLNLVLEKQLNLAIPN